MKDFKHAFTHNFLFFLCRILFFFHMLFSSILRPFIRCFSFVWGNFSPVEFGLSCHQNTFILDVQCLLRNKKQKQTQLHLSAKFDFDPRNSKNTISFIVSTNLRNLTFENNANFLNFWKCAPSVSTQWETVSDCKVRKSWQVWVIKSKCCQKLQLKSKYVT